MRSRELRIIRSTTCTRTTIPRSFVVGGCAALPVVGAALQSAKPEGYDGPRDRARVRHRALGDDRWSFAQRSTRSRPRSRRCRSIRRREPWARRFTAVLTTSQRCAALDAVYLAAFDPASRRMSAMRRSTVLEGLTSGATGCSMLSQLATDLRSSIPRGPATASLRRRFAVLFRRARARHRRARRSPAAPASAARASTR